MRTFPGRRRKLPRLDRVDRGRRKRRTDGRPPGLVSVGILLAGAVLLGVVACVIGRPFGSALMVVGVLFVLAGTLYALFLYRQHLGGLRHRAAGTLVDMLLSIQITWPGLVVTVAGVGLLVVGEVIL